jgi:hypothetical protein
MNTPPMQAASIRDLERISSSVKTKSSAGIVRRLLERENDEHDLRSFSQSLEAALDRFQVFIHNIYLLPSF